ncbi:MAG: OmpH family outer membrane protein [Alphaproteobacteria bacterium]|nr:OmpH family outer membrane protein [Alphaproteobacteria bacterium]
MSFSAFGGNTNIAVVDLKKVAAESKAGKDIEKQMKTINNESKSDLLELESQIKSMESSKKTDLDTRKIEELQVMLYDMVREKKYKISEAYNKAIEKLNENMKSIISNICKKKKIDLVVPQDAVVYSNKNCEDITAEVIKELNKQCPEMSVNYKE